MSRDAWTASFDELDPVRYYTSIISLSIGMRAIMWPMGVAKTRTQLDKQTGAGSLQTRSTFSITREICQKEGVRKLYAGFGVSAFTGLFSAPLFLTAMEKSRQVYINDLHIDASLASAMAGATGSILGQLAIVPSENVSQRIMVDPKAAAKEGVVVERSAWLQCKSIWRSAGVLGFYRGFCVSVMTYTPTSTAFWYLYSNLRWFAQESSWVPAMSNVLMTPLCSSVAGGLAMTITSPLDVVKTRCQIRSITARAAFSELLKEEGPRGFVRGGVQRIGMGSVMYSAFLSSYEGIKWFAQKPKPEVAALQGEGGDK